MPSFVGQRPSFSPSLQLLSLFSEHLGVDILDERTQLFWLHMDQRMIGTRADKVLQGKKGNQILSCASASYAIFRNSEGSIVGYCSFAFRMSGVGSFA